MLAVERADTHATRAGEKLRSQGLAASSIQVFLMTNRFRPELPQYNPGAIRPFIVPTSFTPEIIGEAVRVLKAIYKSGYLYVKTGVQCFGLVPDDEKQASLFRPVDPEQEAKEAWLMAAVDKFNLWGGRGTLRAATLGINQRWQMRRERMSPCYTTRLRDVPQASI